MYKQLTEQVKLDNWVILGYYTYRSARVTDVIINIPYEMIVPILQPSIQDNHVVYHLLDTKKEVEFFLSVSDGVCKLAMSVIEEGW